MGNKIKRLLEILYQYSIEDTAETLFITDVFPANIAAPVKISLLWEAFRASEPLKYQAENKIKNYEDYQALVSQLIALIPSYPMVEDIAVPPDWGEIKYSFEKNDYKFFYYGDLENTYDYLLLYDRLLVANDERLSKVIGRSPRNAFWGGLHIQDTIINLIPRSKPEKRIEPGDFGPATKEFWATARAAYAEINKTLGKRLGKEFLDTYTLPIRDQTIHFSKMPDLVMQGRATPYIFLSANNKLYLANTRRINTVLLTSINDLLEKYNVEFGLAELNTAIYQFLDARFRGVIGPIGANLRLC